MNAIFTEASFQNMMNVAGRYGLSEYSVTDLTHRLMSTNGSMAQFNIPELGGGGQWMQGGMTMVSDLFNYQLKATVDGICVELSNLIQQGAIQYEPLPPVKNPDGSMSQSGNWWGDLGFPNSTGSQNGTSYAIFSSIGRLAIQENGKVIVFDTLDNQIGGVGQQQGGNYSVTFTSQYGTVDLSSLPIVSGGDFNANSNEVASNDYIEREPEPIVQDAVPEPMIQDSVPELMPDKVLKNMDQEEDVFMKLEKLSTLKDKGILTEDEFMNKKAELLSRL